MRLDFSIPAVCGGLEKMSHHSGQHGKKDTLDNHLASEEIKEYRPSNSSDWQKIRTRAFIRLLWHFLDWKNLRFHRGIIPDIAGYAWGGIYRSMLVPQIAASSFRNEGHFRPKGRVAGTESFFGAALRYPLDSPALLKALREVHLRHHVAGVVQREGDSFHVLPRYEAAFAYVSTAFIESIRRGYAVHGVEANSPLGRRVAEDLCTIFYQIAGMAGLKRMPRDLAAHEKFRDSFDAHLRSARRSPWMVKRARELAKRIFPFTAALAGISLRDQRDRYLDSETAEHLLPDARVLEEIQPVYEALRMRFRETAQNPFLSLLKLLSAFKAPPHEEASDLDPLWNAYLSAKCDSVEARLIGAILLHAIEDREKGSYWHIPVRLKFEEAHALIRQGEKPHYCYVLLESRHPLRVTRHSTNGSDPGEEIQIAEISAPNVVGEIGMWRGSAAIASVTCAKNEELWVVRLDQHHFDALKSTPGFWSAAAAEVQRRLRFSFVSAQRLLSAYEERVPDPQLAMLGRMLRHLNGDSHVSLDSIPGIHPESSLAEIIDLLYDTVTALRAAHAGDERLCAELDNLLQLIG